MESLVKSGSRVSSRPDRTSGRLGRRAFELVALHQTLDALQDLGLVDTRTAVGASPLGNVSEDDNLALYGHANLDKPLIVLAAARASAIFAFAVVRHG